MAARGPSHGRRLAARDTITIRQRVSAGIQRFECHPHITTENVGLIWWVCVVYSCMSEPTYCEECDERAVLLVDGAAYCQLHASTRENITINGQLQE